MIYVELADLLVNEITVKALILIFFKWHAVFVYVLGVDLKLLLIVGRNRLSRWINVLRWLRAIFRHECERIAIVLSLSRSGLLLFLLYKSC